jgi:murein DD-endopeptidase MepM/ murein hydrolase activator NlpD
VGTALDLTRGIGLGVDGDVYVLLRSGITGPAGLARYTGSPPYHDGAFAAALPIETPVYLWVDPTAKEPIYVVDRDGARIRALQPGTGEVLYTYTLADGGQPVRAVWAADGKLYLSATGAVIVYPGSGQVHDIAGGQGPPADSRPDNPQRLALLSPLSNPIPGTRFLPERDSLLPGATRIYRFGIHHGLDFYGGTMGIDIPFGSPVRGAGDGVVIRADHGFREMTPAEADAALRRCRELRYTPPDILDRLRGRQVWLDHGGGLVTRYAHLSGIPPEITVGASVSAGQVVGYVGNSGTSDGVAGGVEGPHLHFEVFLGDDYVGKWLTVPEVRRVLQQYLFP